MTTKLGSTPQVLVQGEQLLNAVGAGGRKGHFGTQVPLPLSKTSLMTAFTTKVVQGEIFPPLKWHCSYHRMSHSKQE